eukprot:scaffold3075_cov134-Amphora_coffeaeformis.AAC.8
MEAGGSYNNALATQPSSEGEEAGRGAPIWPTGRGLQGKRAEGLRVEIGRGRCVVGGCNTGNVRVQGATRRRRMAKRGRRGLAKAVVPLKWRGRWARGWGEGKGARGNMATAEADGEKGPERSCKGGGSPGMARKMGRGLGRRRAGGGGECDGGGNVDVDQGTDRGAGKWAVAILGRHTNVANRGGSTGQEGRRLERSVGGG